MAPDRGYTRPTQCGFREYVLQGEKKRHQSTLYSLPCLFANRNEPACCRTVPYPLSQPGMHFLSLSRVISPLGSPSWSSQPAQILSFSGNCRTVIFCQLSLGSSFRPFAGQGILEDFIAMRDVLSSLKQLRKADLRY